MAQAERHDSTSPSRRRFLLTAPAAAVSIHQGGLVAAEAALFGLEPRIREAQAALESAFTEFNVADAAMATWRKANPRPRNREALSEWERLEAEVCRESRFDELEQEVVAATDREFEVLDELADSPATTVEGLRFKARFAAPDNDVAQSIVDDLRAMEVAS